MKKQARERKIQKQFTYHGLGFPVVLEDVPVVRIDGQWAPEINYKTLQECMVVALACKHSRLTGDEIRFLRRYFDMTLEQFASLFDYSYQAVMKWEARKDAPAEMLWPAELALRLFALERMGMSGDQFLRAYSTIAHGRLTRPKAHRLHADTISSRSKVLEACLA